MIGFLLAMLLAQADGGVDFTTAMRDPAQRTKAACEALARSGKGYDGCALNHVVEVKNDDGQPRFLVFFRHALPYERVARPLGEFVVFRHDGGALRDSTFDLHVVEPKDRLSPIGPWPLVLLQERPWTIRCHSGPPLEVLQVSLRSFTGTYPAKLVLLIGPPSGEAVTSPVPTADGGLRCYGTACTDEPAVRVSAAEAWSWRVDCGDGCAVRVGPAALLASGDAGVTLDWNDEMHRFDRRGSSPFLFDLPADDHCGFELPLLMRHLDELAARYCRD